MKLFAVTNHHSIRQFLAILILAATTTCCGGRATVSRSDIRLAAGDLASLAAAGAFLCEEASRKEVDDTFLQTQASLISEKARDTSRGIGGDGGDLEETRESVARSAMRLSSKLDDLLSGMASTTESADQLSSMALGLRQIKESLEDK